MKSEVDFINVNGRNHPQTVFKCKKCHTSVVTIQEYDRIRKEVYPSFSDKIKNLFKGFSSHFDLSKGKIL